MGRRRGPNISREQKEILLDPIVRRFAKPTDQGGLSYREIADYVNKARKIGAIKLPRDVSISDISDSVSHQRGLES